MKNCLKAVTLFVCMQVLGSKALVLNYIGQTVFYQEYSNEVTIVTEILGYFTIWLNIYFIFIFVLTQIEALHNVTRFKLWTYVRIYLCT